MDIDEDLIYDFENDLQDETNEFISYDNELNTNVDENNGHENILFEEDLFTIEMEDDNINTVTFEYGNYISLKLTPKEEDIILKCKDRNLQKLLVYNRMRLRQLKETRLRLIKTHNVCKYYFKREMQQMSDQADIKFTPVVMSKTWCWKLGTPYFKDSFNFGAPANLDVQKKLNNNECMITRFCEGRRWVDNDQMTLLNSVKTMYYHYYVTSLKRKKDNLLRQIVNEEVDSQLVKVDQELEILLNDKTQRKTPPFKSNLGIDWTTIANGDLDGKHSSQECKALWHIYLHPDINKTNWTPDENSRILELAAKHNYQDWDLIAEELGTNRTGYLVCVHYHAKLCEKFSRQRFQPKEDKLLVQVVENCKIGNFIPWNTVALYFEDRSRHQLYHRYKYYLYRKDSIVRGLFTEAEDILIVYLVQKYGRNFIKLSELMPQRSSVQLRNRYTCYLENIIMPSGFYTEEEDRCILDHVKVHGLKKWTAVSNKLQRPRSQVRQRYYTIQKVLDRDPTISIQDIPRRNQEQYSRAQAQRFERLHTILGKLENFTGVVDLDVVKYLLVEESKIKVKNAWKNTGRLNPCSSTDRKILRFFKGCSSTQKKIVQVPKNVWKKSVQRIIKIFEALGGDPTILKECKPDHYKADLTDKELQFLVDIKTFLNSNIFRQNLQQPIQCILPVNKCSLVGLRGLIVKFELYKETVGKDFLLNVKCNSLHKEVNKNVEIIDQNLIKNDWNIFFQRFYAIFKWSCIISQTPPYELTNTINPNILKNEESTRAPGRPPKQSYPKVNKMLQVKRKRKQIRDKTTSILKKQKVIPLSNITLPKDTVSIKKDTLMKYIETNKANIILFEYSVSTKDSKILKICKET